MPRISSDKHIFILFGLIVVFFLLRVPFLNKEYVFEEPFLVKSGEGIAQTGYPQYYVGEQSAENPMINLLKPPLFALTLGALFKIFSSMTFIARLAPLFFNFGTLLLIFLFCRRFLRSPAAGLVAGFLFAVNPFFIQNSIQIDLDGGIVTFFLTLFIFVSAVFFSKPERRFRDWLLIGLVFLLSFSAKIEPSLMIAFAVFLWLAFSRKSLKTIVLFILTLIFAVGLFFLLFYFYNLHFGHPEQTVAPVALITHIFNAFFIPRFKGKVIDANALKPWQESAALFAIYFVWITPAFIIGLGLLLRKIKEIWRQPILRLFALWFLVMAGTYFLFGNTGPGYPRYLAPVSVPVFILLGYFLIQSASDRPLTQRRISGIALALGGAVIFFALLPKLLLGERKLIVNLSLLSDRGQFWSVFFIAFFWLSLFLLLLAASFWKRFGWRRAFFTAMIFYFAALPFYFARDVFADYSLTNVYGQSGFRATGEFLRNTLPPGAVILTDDAVGYYYGGKFFDFGFSSSALDASARAKLISAFRGRKIAAVALSGKYLTRLESDPEFSPYLLNFSRRLAIGTHLLFF